MSTYRDMRRTVFRPDYCRRLRQEATDAEARLWQILRARRLGGFKFRRQHEFGPYILDFLCTERALVVEADGGQHYEVDGVERDRLRDQFLRSRGLRVLRFSDREILMSTTAIAEQILQHLVAAPSP